MSIVDALLNPNLLNASRGDLIACLAWIPFDVQGGVPLMLKCPDGWLLRVDPFCAGTTREEVKEMLCKQVDGIFDNVAMVPK